MTHEYKGAMTLAEFEEMIQLLQQKIDEAPKEPMYEIPSGILLTCSDEEFKLLWHTKDTFVRCGMEAMDKINERARKLKLIIN